MWPVYAAKGNRSFAGCATTEMSAGWDGQSVTAKV